VRPYFERDGVTLYHASCMELMATMAARSVGCTITDPPFAGRTHDGARSNPRRGEGKRNGGVAPIDFAPISPEWLDAAVAEVGRVSRRWVVATMDLDHAARTFNDPPAGLRGIRVGVWLKTNPTPQITGDRPAQGWEAISICHVDEGRSWWNGGGRPATYIGPNVDSACYPTQKPEWLIARFIADFCDPGESIFDPFAGGGTTLVCAWKAGHPVIGCDIREEACEVAARRLERVMSQGRLDLPRAPRAKQAALFG
jgi:site-specific DNA-methyltransferase (adenine-specific)